jgi:hypothetical protein
MECSTGFFIEASVVFLQLHLPHTPTKVTAVTAVTTPARELASVLARLPQHDTK